MTPTTAAMPPCRDLRKLTDPLPDWPSLCHPRSPRLRNPAIAGRVERYRFVERLQQDELDIKPQLKGRLTQRQFSNPLNLRSRAQSPHIGNDAIPMGKAHLTTSSRVIFLDLTIVSCHFRLASDAPERSSKGRQPQFACARQQFFGVQRQS
jgi:hypothetical protein